MQNNFFVTTSFEIIYRINFFKKYYLKINFIYFSKDIKICYFYFSFLKISSRQSRTLKINFYIKKVILLKKRRKKKTLRVLNSIFLKKLSETISICFSKNSKN